jgi:hypothetical protein
MFLHRDELRSAPGTSRSSSTSRSPRPAGGWPCATGPIPTRAPR